MIYMGYAGQFDEVDRGWPFWVWGAVSTVFFVGLLVLVYRVVHGNLRRLPREVHGLVRGVWWLVFASWMLYPGAYLMPALWEGRRLSALEGWEPAQQAEVTMPPRRCHQRRMTDLGGPIRPTAVVAFSPPRSRR